MVVVVVRGVEGEEEEEGGGRGREGRGEGVCVVVVRTDDLTRMFIHAHQ